MPTLLQINITVNWGSTGKIAEHIGRCARVHGWESFIAYGRWGNPSKSHLIKVGNMVDMYLHYGEQRFRDNEGLCSRGATKRLIRQIEEIRPDVVQLHNIHDHYLNYRLLYEYLSSTNINVVWTFHDCWAFTGGCAYFDIPLCDKWISLCSQCPQRKNKIDKSSSHFKKRQELIASLGKRLTIVPVSAWLETFCQKSMLRNCSIRLIHNGIDTEKFKTNGSKNTKPLILGVALAWTARKGLEDFIRLREVISENKADIVLIGLSEQQIKNLPIGIKGLSKTQSLDELVRLYNQASVLVNPTYADNFPTVNLEALACGTPVVTYRTGGSPEAVDDKTGIVVAKGDINALADSIMQVLNHPEKYSRENCQGRAEKLFNKDRQFGKYIDLYEELISHQE